MADNTNEEHLDIPTNTQSESPSEGITPSEDTEAITQNQETVNMETHAHDLHKVPGHGWKHYLFEFLMLFLAVFCGFLAENFREHLIEGKKEKAFMRSLIEDLKKDTSRLNYSIRRIKSDIANADSLVMAYVKGKKSGTYEKDMAIFGLRCGLSVDVVFNDQTSSQLKGTGSMRLIENKEIVDSLVQYWNNQIRIAQIHDRFEITRHEQRKIGYQTFNWYPLNYSYQIDSSIINLHLNDFIGISNDQMINEFVNVSSNLYNAATTQYLPELLNESTLEYSLKNTTT